MIPLRDTINSKNYPIVNNSLIFINVMVFIIELSQGPEFKRFIYLYGLVPARYSVPEIANYFSMGQQAFSLVSFIFLHGGFWHLLGNMWSLYIFGDNVEDHLGPIRYLLFYFLCGLTSGITHLAFNLHSTVPTIGASGAIAGVMGAYLILYPHSKILTLIPIIIIPYFIEIPAYFFLGIWFVFQFINAAGTHADVAGIAWWAHIGGFVFGIIFLKVLGKIPSGKFSEKLQHATERKKTPRLQVIHPVGPGNDLNLYGTIEITPYEACQGTSKMVNIPWGFQKRLVKVHVPPDVKEGNMLRLIGLGKHMPGAQRGDLFLKVAIQRDGKG